MPSSSKATLRLALILSCAFPACTQRVVYDSWDQWVEDTGAVRGGARKVSARAAPRGQTQRTGGWALLLATFMGDQHQQDAREAAARLVSQANLPDVWLHDTVDRTLLYRGRYTDSDSDEAKNAQRQTRMIKFDGLRPFEDAQIVPIAETGTAVAGPHDLRQFRDMYTLQVEVYDDDIGPKYRQTAQKRVEALREEGHGAYFYHGPHRSMVTVGLFARKQAFVLRGTTDTYAPAVRELQKNFPLNVHNGHSVVEKKGGKKIRDQPSFLVRVP